MDTTVKKVDSSHSPRGSLGQTHLVSGKTVALRRWTERGDEESESARDYETVGYVIQGRAELELEGQKVSLEPGDAWLVPRGARHRYRVLEPFEAVDATSPPAHVHGRDDPQPGS